MTANALLSPATGDNDDNPSQPQGLSRAAPDGPSPAVPFDPRLDAVLGAPRGAMGAMGQPAPPTVPSARRRSERPAIPLAPAPLDRAGAGPMAPADPAPGWPLANPITAIGHSAPVAAPIAPDVPMAGAAVGAPAVPLGAVSAPAAPVPVTYAPAEPAPSGETHLTPDEPSDIASYIPLPGCPHPLFTFIKRWAPTFVPTLEGAFAVAVALTLIARAAPVGDNLASFGGVPTLLVIYLVGGALFGIALYFAASDTVWFASLALGGLLLPTLILAPLLGWALGGFEVVFALVLAVVVLRLHYQTVADNTVAVTKLFGRYFRIIRPGSSLHLPFERVVATLDTHERAYATPTQYIELTSPQGVPYRGRATCTAIYSILPGEAHRVVPMLDTWERDLQQVLILTVREALGDWAAHVTVTGIAPPQGTLARAVLEEARAWAHLRGIWIMRVRVHNIWLEPAASGPWPATSAPYSVGISAVPGGSAPSIYPPGISSAGAGLYPASARAMYGAPSASAQPIAPSLPAWQAYHSDQPAYLAPAARAPSVASLAPVPHRFPDLDRSRQASHISQASQLGEADEPVAVSGPPTPASAEVLATAYEAVRDGRISDPLTIRGIAHAFAHVAEHAPAASAFPYDAATAARILWEYADRLEQRLAVSAPAEHP